MSFDFDSTQDRSQAMPNPAAGVADWDVTVPKGMVYKIIGFYARLVTDANVANRQVVFSHVTRSGGVKSVSGLAQAQTAGLTFQYSCAIKRFNVNLSAYGFLMIEIPDILLFELETFRITIFNNQVGDQWSLGHLVWQEAQMKDVIK